ncbi:cupin domain-containing protein [Paenibacillaceae bacterium]|nr:cupin domain-containing protein [Paenibacillaceae bacterium]
MSKIGVWEAAEPGVKRKFLAVGAGLMMMEVHFEAGAAGKVHSHPHEQMSYCMQGSFDFTIDGQVHLLKAGEAIAIPGGALHGVLAREQSILLDAFTPIREDLLQPNQ